MPDIVHRASLGRSSDGYLLTTGNYQDSAQLMSLSERIFPTMDKCFLQYWGKADEKYLLRTTIWLFGPQVLNARARSVDDK